MYYTILNFLGDDIIAWCSLENVLLVYSNPSIRPEGGLTFETSTWLSVDGGNLTLIKLFDTKF